MMRLLYSAALGLALSCLASMPARAEDKAPCGTGLICASKPETVMAAMEKAGFKPTLSKDDGGDPMIESREATYNFAVFFYGCENHVNCDSLRFEASFDKAPENTAALANKWNATKRFVQASVRDGGEMVFAYDVPTIGGLNPDNFADVLDWWTVELEALGKFFKEELNLPDPPEPAKK